MELPRRPRILLLIPHLGGGGAERVTAHLACGLSKEKYDLHLATVTQSHSGLPALPAHVVLHPLGARRVRSGAMPILRLVRSIRPSLVLSGMVHLNFLVLLLRPFFPRHTRVLVRQNSSASAALEFGGLPSYTRIFYRLLYRRADRVICQTPAMAADLHEAFGIPSAKLAILPNPVDVEGTLSRVTDHGAAPSPNDGDPGPRLLVVGRLSKEKGFDLLLEALAVVRQSLSSTTLVIAGAGPEESALKSQSLSLGLESAVRFAGNIADPVTCFADAALFVLSSRYEGLPNALLEAAAAGLPIVSVPSSQGVVDLLCGQPGVWLANEISAPALADSLLAALRSLRPAERFAHRFIEPFRLERVIGAYEKLIDSALSGESR
ncbi:MAG TPA: glycosyltransferase [Terracidiphilus sp.]|nr:glycosyltransferase [Terracidiphilus sp.]